MLSPKQKKLLHWEYDNDNATLQYLRQKPRQVNDKKQKENENDNVTRQATGMSFEGLGNTQKFKLDQAKESIRIQQTLLDQ